MSPSRPARRAIPSVKTKSRKANPAVRGLCSAAFAMLIGVSTAQAVAEPVRTEGGLVTGERDHQLSVFKGIPFAAPPIGPLRWHDPMPAAAWTGVRDATQFAPACKQLPAFAGAPRLADSEDCLYLNVWTPAQTARARLPVMVWIHGGAFVSGATGMPEYSQAELSRRGVVVVSIAYRLGAFGFLASPDLNRESGHGSGTYGLQDQIAALNWVKRNIARFGGDPNRITAFGESAGAASVSMLAASPRAKGLFQRAIAESAGAFSPSRISPDDAVRMPALETAAVAGRDYLGRLGAATLAQARALPADTVLQGPAGDKPAWRPVRDGYVNVGDPSALYASRRYNDTPVLIGSNGDEGAFFIPEMTADRYAAAVRAKYGSFADRILDAYPGRTDTEALHAARHLLRDTAMAWPIWTWARLQSETGKSAVYVYYFNHRPPYPDMAPYQDWGASHGAEIGYVFGRYYTATPDAEERKLSDLMQAYWVNFATSGDPNGPGLPTWPAFTPGRQDVLKFEDGAQAVDLPNRRQLELLDGYLSEGDHGDRPKGRAAASQP